MSRVIGRCMDSRGTRAVISSQLKCDIWQQPQRHKGTKSLAVFLCVSASLWLEAHAADSLKLVCCSPGFLYAVPMRLGPALFLVTLAICSVSITAAQNDIIRINTRLVEV